MAIKISAMTEREFLERYPEFNEVPEEPEPHVANLEYAMAEAVKAMAANGYKSYEIEGVIRVMKKGTY